MLSFVIPAYNEGRWIARCIDRIQSEIRNYPEQSFEIIVVDNGSTDNTADIAHSYSDVKVVPQPIRGLVAARKAGFEASTGDLVANIDSDTLIPEGWVKKVLDMFRTDPNLVALSGPIVYYDMPLYVRMITHLFYRIAVFSTRRGSILQGGNFVLFRAHVELAQPFNPEKFFFYGEDTEIARCMSKVGKVKFSFDLWAESSGRRLKQEGVLRVGITYMINYFWTRFFTHPFTLDWKNHR